MRGSWGRRTPGVRKQLLHENSHTRASTAALFSSLPKAGMTRRPGHRGTGKRSAVHAHTGKSLGHQRGPGTRGDVGGSRGRGGKHRERTRGAAGPTPRATRLARAEQVQDGGRRCRRGARGGGCGAGGAAFGEAQRPRLGQRQRPRNRVGTLSVAESHRQEARECAGNYITTKNDARRRRAGGRGRAAGAGSGVRADGAGGRGAPGRVRGAAPGGSGWRPLPGAAWPAPLSRLRLTRLARCSQPQVFTAPQLSTPGPCGVLRAAFHRHR